MIRTPPASCSSMGISAINTQLAARATLITCKNKLHDTSRWAGFDFFNIPDDARDVAIFDANGDGRNDILTVNTFGEQPRLFINVGSYDRAVPIPRFQEDTSFMIPWNKPAPHFCAVAVGDIDNDGDPDLFFSDYSNDLEDRLCVNDGTGFFTDVTDTQMTPDMSVSAFGTGCLIHDFNGDGFNDIVKISTLFSPQVLRMCFNDVNQDGKLDLLIGGCFGLELYFQD